MIPLAQPHPSPTPLHSWNLGQGFLPLLSLSIRFLLELATFLGCEISQCHQELWRQMGVTPAPRWVLRF